MSEENPLEDVTKAPVSKADYQSHLYRQRGYFRKLRRCQARAKSHGGQCGRPAMKGKNVCDIHGGKAGAPRGNQNAKTHGRRSRAYLAERRAFREELRDIKSEAAAIQKAAQALERKRRADAKSEAERLEKEAAKKLEEDIAVGRVIDLAALNRKLLEQSPRVEAEIDRTEEILRRRRAQVSLEATGLPHDGD